MGFFNRLLQRISPRRQTPAERAESEAQEAARKYWEREVADERERRGTPDADRK